MHGMGCTPLPPKKKEDLMSTTTFSSSSIADPVVVPAKTATSHCPYLYPNGKRCSLPGFPAHSGFCLRHSQAIAPVALPVHVQNDSEDFSADLLPEPSEFECAIDINKFLAKLLVLVTKRPRLSAPRLRPGLHHQPAPPLPPRHYPGNQGRRRPAPGNHLRHAPPKA